MPVYVPRELIHAAGMLPVGILGGGDQLEVIQGDAYYQSYICRIPRSTIELGLTGRLDCLDGMLFPSICDVIRNLSGMWQILFKDKYVALPRRAAELRGRDRRRASTSTNSQCCATTSADLRGAPITDAELNASIAVYNDNRRAVRELYAYRAAKPWQAPTSEVYLVLRAGMVLPPEEHTQLVRDYIAAADALPRPKRDNARVVINGSFCEQPPLGLIKSIEMSGCYVVDDDFMLVTRWLLDDVPADGNPLEELSKAFLHRSASTAAKYDAKARGQGRLPAEADQDPRRRGRDLRRAVVLRPGAARAADAAGRAQPAQDPAHRVQVRREHRPDGADPRAGRHVSPIRSSCGAQREPHFDEHPKYRGVEGASHDQHRRHARQHEEAADVQKEDAMWLQKELINNNYMRARAPPARRTARCRRPSCRAISTSS